ncbi:hypothetical protein [Methanogenium sp. MK-MG]|uniref:hypothetical protein n=1 Tax=Methanogenium sp. MK-MG TaxID=2599926 RepID=UPI0013ED414B|nr:hypothetical protein [Methanogenium sp. MK-MG]KAF1073647.1 hypothetical protein MKMG_02103 [Methanogenium sp. MK-MG]
MAGDLDREYAVWVTPDELGKKKEIHLKGKTVTFRVPEHIDGHVVLRLKGLGSRSGSQTGNLLVRINLMEEDRSTGGAPFSRNRQRSSPNGGFGPFSWMYRSGDQERQSGPGSPFTQREVVKDPMQHRRAGLLITGAGLVLVAGGYLGILPLSAWAGSIIVVAGVYVAFFA